MENSILLCYAILFYLSIIEMNLRTDVLSQRDIPIKKHPYREIGMLSVLQKVLSLFIEF